MDVTQIQFVELNAELELEGVYYRFCAVSIGNTHCVIVLDDVNSTIAKRLGPIIESHSRFPHRTNVQFLKGVEGSDVLVVLNKQKRYGNGGRVTHWHRGPAVVRPLPPL